MIYYFIIIFIKTINIIKPSNNRIQPKCPYISECGGCNLMHMPFDMQMEFKKNKLKDILNKYAGIDIDIKLIESNKDLFYRNKIELKVNKNKFSYYNHDSHDNVYINRCLLANNTITIKDKGYRKNFERRGNLHIIAKIIMPDNLSSKEIALYTELKNIDK